MTFFTLYFAVNTAAENGLLIAYYRKGKYMLVTRGKRSVRKKVLRAEERVLMRAGRNKGKAIPSKEAFGESLAWLVHPQWWQLSWIDKILWLFGMFWVGFPPYSKLYSYTLEYEKQTDPNKYVMVPQIEKDTQVADLAHTYLIAVSGVELSDQSRINLAGELLLHTIDVDKAVVTMDGKWFRTVMSGVKGAIIDYCKGKTYAQLTKDDKGNPKSGLVKAILAAVNQHVATADTDVMGFGMSVSDTTGMQAEGFFLRDMDTPEDAPEMKKAREAKALEIEKAAALEIESKGKAVALKIRGDAEALYHTTVGNAQATISKKRRDELGNDVLRGKEIDAEALASLKGLTTLATGIIPLAGSTPTVNPPATA
jgi:hypothetical protein